MADTGAEEGKVESAETTAATTEAAAAPTGDQPVAPVQVFEIDSGDDDDAGGAAAQIAPAADNADSSAAPPKTDGGGTAAPPAPAAPQAPLEVCEIDSGDDDPPPAAAAESATAATAEGSSKPKADDAESSKPVSDDELIEVVGGRRRRGVLPASVQEVATAKAAAVAQSVAAAVASAPEVAIDDGGGEAADPADPDRLARETDPFPALPARSSRNTSPYQMQLMTRAKHQASLALENGDVEEAIKKYTEAILTGCATALVIATRAELLLKCKRPCAAIRDCTAAIRVNPDCGKAYRIRGLAQRALGRFKAAHSDLAQGQKLDFDEQTVLVQEFVALKVGLAQKKAAELGTLPKMEGHESAMKLIHGEDLTGDTPASGSTANPLEGRGPGGGGPALKSGAAVWIRGLQKAPQLNGKRGVALTPADGGRWQIEIRMDKGLVETKAIKTANLMPVGIDGADTWKDEEKKHREERRKRDEERRKEEKRKELERQVMTDGIPRMDPSEELEAETSGLDIDEKAMALLRSMDPIEALEIVKMVVDHGIGSPSSFIEEEANRALSGNGATAAKATASSAAANAAPMEVEDAELYPKDGPPFLPLPESVLENPTEVQMEAMYKAKEEAADALDDGNLDLAVQKYTEAIMTGAGATSLMLAKRAELLLRQRRPCAAIRDCTDSLELNPECGKAYRIRGTAHRRIGNWHDAQRDLAQGQTLDYDDEIAELQRLVDEKVRLLGPGKRPADASEETSPTKRAKAE
mmetsp:Transcript_10218/g.22494  ORF Transcript_10218/g.22494 Transcript_10218/m.22494 type:complete len:754 (-) Transcript_10218:48-2309(-)